MLCLGIETSCDETALALVHDGRLLGQCLHSQEKLHALFGGVVPELASRGHLTALPVLLERLLKRTGLTIRDVQVVAAARGPGLLGSLLVGLGMAKGLALSLGVPLVGVNHLHAHLLAAGLEREIPFPALGLLVSGGHTQLYRITSPFQFELLGKTLDDAAGEALDKAASMLNLPYPGGLHIDALAAGTEPNQSLFPRPYLDNRNLDFSFSGLKTAFSQHLASRPELRLPRLPDKTALTRWAEDHPELGTVCASLNWSIAETLRTKVKRALTDKTAYRAVIAAGGVAANTMLRSLLAETTRAHGLSLILPSPALCTDNAAMIAYSGWLLARDGWRHDLTMEALPRGKPIPWDFLPRSLPNPPGSP
ncbi:tRNA (adenosine(37)-N6)-threonylcarbamoyltransferase complex transferase subunit TsaD [Desulfonatronum sp. SC1]|uniref:tRNA (adenosine(37)-N6)-threonylcarbamoyltransferase complex transferase subunit TsaD n=1 Tax=Desulfonatronum sp. SC1 TaxID=2109626 RepID=UPI000D317154|nr:tRNA (adenosine(37)-N6)-threonylcarbamoyltransferase complex transferase subunit TsaD [Desulfonatronum sp. SC1]PTN38044.1 tRNA (adenosine(37)-N6)-threonylcarbamoyltransferase complex transferase subunit TsaD [Desulfonatronum sp. SC1]